ncbi:MAG: hypothetical protein V7786_02075 [Sulfitobacter litoralis]|uniref:hypothetical protein n=1 Tax=Sulfitobacter litoralis TaxID=335975 RepID=UPI0030037AED
MTEAPERIWAEPDGEDIIIHNGKPNLEALISTGYLSEYVRSDLARPMTVAEAAKVLLDRWLVGEFEDTADAEADDALESGNDSTAIIETWLRALSQGGE